MSRNPERIAATLTPAQRRALANAFLLESARPAWTGFYPRLDVRMDTRRRLIDRGLLSRRPAHMLTKLGRDVRNILRTPQ